MYIIIAQIIVIGLFSIVPFCFSGRIRVLSAVFAAVTSIVAFLQFGLAVECLPHWPAFMRILALSVIASYYVAFVIEVRSAMDGPESKERADRVIGRLPKVFVVQFVCFIMVGTCVWFAENRYEVLAESGLTKGLPDSEEIVLDWRPQEGISNQSQSFDLEDALVQDGRNFFLKREDLAYSAIENVHVEWDDQQEAMVVCTIADPKMFSVTRVKGVAVWNPATGEYAKYDIGATPKWIRSVFDEKLAKERIGVFNSKYLSGGERHITKHLTGSVLVINAVTGKSGESYFYAETYVHEYGDGMHQLLSGFVFLNLRSGEMHFEEVVGMTKTDAMRAMTNAVSRDGNWHAGAPTPLKLEGVGWAYCSDILNYKDEVEGLAIVRFKDGQVFHSTTATQAIAKATFEPLLESGRLAIND